MAAPPFSVHPHPPGDSLLPTDALLAHPQPPSAPAPQPPTASRFLIILTAALAVSTSYLLLLRPPLSTVSLARPLSKLRKPVVLLISSDGFRFGYHLKAPTPHIRRLIANGTSAAEGLIPVFPTLTFPNHYSIATGLYPSSHGIINNFFPDPISGDKFIKTSLDPKWWLGEPLWVTAADQGVQASTYFWPGSEVKKGSWDCPVDYCPKYDASVPFKDRVDAILRYFDPDFPVDKMPQLMTLYFEDPDAQGHKVGPDHRNITDAVKRIDEMIGRLIAGLETRGVFEDVNIILVGDHGMVGTCGKKLVFLEEFAPWIEDDWVLSIKPLLAIRPPDGVSPEEVVAKMKMGLSFENVTNRQHLKVYLKKDLPSRLEYSESYRIPPIIGMVDEGYKVEMKKTLKLESECAGAHGYDNDFFSMRSIFIAHGPRFEKGKTVPSFVNVEIYNVVASILNLKPAPNNGSASFPETVLLPSE